MPIVKSISVGLGDMFYIRHGTDNFSIIDCCLSDDDGENIVDELVAEKSGKNVTRFISTHPDNDHIRGLSYLDDRIDILNFYCVKNDATKDDQTDDFDRYRLLRDSSKKASYLKKGCVRRWMNQVSEERGGSGLHVLWPVVTNEHYKDALASAANGESPNDISIILTYSLDGGVRIAWMGDLA